MLTPQSLGGKAKAKKVYEMYLLSPNTCHFCGLPILRRFDNEKLAYVKKRRFCNHSCCARYFNKSRIKNKSCKICGIAIPNDRKKCDKCLSIYSGSLGEKKKCEASVDLIRHHARKVFREFMPKIECSICGYNKFTEICHKKSLSNFGSETLLKEINCIDNLIQLCPNCHWEYDHKLIIS